MAALTAEHERFAEEVARRTGLQLPTVRTWVAQEGGPASNPLNIMGWTDSGKRFVRDFGGVDGAVAATVDLLHDARYQPVLATARQTANVRSELQAIALSPWEENRYRGTTSQVGALLFGTYRSLYGDTNAQLAKAPPTEDGKRPGQTPDSPVYVPPGEGGKFWKALNPIDNLGEFAVTILAYVAFTAVAAWLVVMGLTRSLGASPLELAGAARGRRAAADDIPF